MRITQEDLDLWINALLSGKYKQGFSRLNKNNMEFCCLGVLCEVFVEKGVLVPLMDPIDNTVRYFDLSDGKSEGGASTFATLPLKISRMLGCDGLGPAISKETVGVWKLGLEGYAAYQVAILNDRGYTFPEIAELLKKVAVIVPDYDQQKI